MVPNHHKGFTRYNEAFPELGIAFIAEVDWTTFRMGRWHSHLEHQFLFILDGFMDVDTLDQHFEGPPGSLYVLPSEQQHIVQQREDPSRVRFIDLRLTANPPVTLAQFLIALGRTQLHASDAAFRQMALGLREAVALSGPQKMARLHTVLWNALTELRELEGPLETADLGRVHLRAAESAMKDRMADAVDVNDIARASGLSRSQLSRLYAKHLGIGPAERMRQLRVERACELLRVSTLSIKQIAHACGFACPNHFCRVFQQISGQTPTEYRTLQAAG
jgi:AraC-like DNA-binding protein